jgi:hypothetical protein
MGDRTAIQVGSAVFVLFLLIGAFFFVPVVPQPATASKSEMAAPTIASSIQTIANGDYIQYTVTVGSDTGIRRFDFSDVNATQMTVDITSTSWYFGSQSFTANYSYEDNMILVPGLMGKPADDTKTGEVDILTVYGVKHVNVFSYWDTGPYSDVLRTFLVPFDCLVYYKYFGNDTDGNHVVITLNQTNIGWLQDIGQLANESDFNYFESGGEATITGYHGAGGAIYIPSTLGGYPVTIIGDSAFALYTNLTSVSIGLAVQTIAGLAFRWCSSLTSVLFWTNLTSIGEWAFANCGLISVSIPNSVTAIGVNAFATNPTLTRITVGAGNPSYSNKDNDGVLYDKAITVLMQYPGGRMGTAFTLPNSVVSIGQYAANSCTHLTSVTLPAGLMTIGTNAFRYCANLTSISFLGLVAPTDVGSDWIVFTNPDLRGHAYNSSNFPAPGGVWNGLIMGAARTVDADYTYSLSGGDATITGYIGIGGELIIPSTLDGFPVVAIGYGAFSGSTTITSVTIPNSVTSMEGGNAFYGCTALTSATLGNGILGPGMWAFAYCTSLTSVTIPEGINHIDYAAFFGCSALTSVTLPSSINFMPELAFAYCTNLVSITFLGLVAPSSVYLSWIEGDSSLLRGHAYAISDFPAPGAVWNGLTMGLTIDAPIINGYTYSVNAGKVTILGYSGAGGSIVIPSSFGAYPTTVIGNGAFSHIANLTSVTIPDSVTSIGSEAFYLCTGLVSVIMGNGVASIGQMAFSSCSSLTSVDIPDSVSYIGGWGFVSCTSLATVDLPFNLTGIGDSTFAYCGSLTSVSIPNGVKTIGEGAFFGDSSLIDAILPINLTSIGQYAFAGTSITFADIHSKVWNIGEGAFNGIETLTEISVSASNKVYASADGVLYDKNVSYLMQCPGGKNGSLTLPSTVAYIGDYAFNNCPSLTSVTLPSGVIYIGRSAFQYCSGLTSVNIPNGVTTIWDSTFHLCTSLTSITIPEDVTAIGYEAFASCTSLTSITFSGLVAPTEVGSDWIRDTPAGLRGHAPADSNFPAQGNTWNGLMMGGAILGVAGAPANLTAIPGNAQVFLSWTAPVNDGGYGIAHYDLYRSTAETGTYLLIASPSGLSYSDTGLINNQTYWYSVCAVNAAGAGARTEPASALPSDLPSGYARHDSGKGYSILVPSGWSVEEDVTMGGNFADIFMTGPMSHGIQTNVVVVSGTDSSIRDTHAYLEAQVQATRSALEAEVGMDVVLTGALQYVEISNHSAVKFGWDIVGSGMHQVGVVIIDAEHMRFWAISCTESVDARSEFDLTFDTMIYGFTITSVPGLTNTDVMIIVVIAVIVGLSLIGTLVYFLTRKKCPRCGKRVKKDGTVCLNCGNQLGSMVPASCRYCGTKLEPGWNICPNCGKEVGARQIK